MVEQTDPKKMQEVLLKKLQEMGIPLTDIAALGPMAQATIKAESDAKYERGKAEREAMQNLLGQAFQGAMLPADGMVLTVTFTKDGQGKLSNVHGVIAVPDALMNASGVVHQHIDSVLEAAEKVETLKTVKLTWPVGGECKVEVNPTGTRPQASKPSVAKDATTDQKIRGKGWVKADGSDAAVYTLDAVFQPNATDEEKAELAKWLPDQATSGQARGQINKIKVTVATRAGYKQNIA